MANICRPILEYREIIASTGITIDEAKPPKKTLRRFIRLLGKVDDPRLDGMIAYPLPEILMIAFLAVLAGASAWTEISRFGIKKQKWLKKFLKLENGIPSHDTFRRTFALIDPSQLEKATVFFLLENMAVMKRSLGIREDGQKRLINVDGKEQNGTGRKYGTDEKIRNLQTLHVYDASNGICLISRPIAQKTNEIPVAQDVLSTMQLKDTIVTFDSMNTQRDTIAIIAEQKGDYVGALKGNHETFFEEVGTWFSDQKKKSIKEKSVNYYETIEKAHNQVETRCYYLTTSISWFEDKKNWKKLKGFVCYEKKTSNLVTGRETTEIRYYITSLKDVQLCAESIRGQWGVESLHWHLDVNFGEDDNTTMDKNAFTNLSILNKLSLTLLKLAQPLMDNTSIRGLRKEFSWDLEECLSVLLNAFDENTLRSAFENAKKK